MFVDTSAWVAYMSDREARHEQVARLIENPTGRLHTSRDVLMETTTVLARRAGHKVATEFAKLATSEVLAQTHLSDATVDIEAWRLFEKRSDKRYSMVDCVSFILMRRHGLKAAISLDEDFRQEGFDVLP